MLPDGSGLIARRGQGQFPNYENVIPKAPLEAKVVFQREALLDGLTKTLCHRTQGARARAVRDAAGAPGGRRGRARDAQACAVPAKVAPTDARRRYAPCESACGGGSR